MLLVIFGAGGSYDSLHRRSPIDGGYEFTPYARPPLADQLFAPRPNFLSAMSEFSIINDIIPRLQLLTNTSLEKELQKIYDAASDYPPFYSKLLAVRYYLQTVIWRCEDEWKNETRGHTNYAALLGEIDQWRYGASERVLLTTFNYDRLLEEALENAIRIPVRVDRYLRDYISNPAYKLYKLHGSVDWARTVNTEEKLPENSNHRAAAWTSINEGKNLRLTDTYCLVDSFPTGHVNGFRAVPALAIPLVNKNELECPPDHRISLAGEMPKVNKILIVGWRGTEKHLTVTLAAATGGRTVRLLISCGTAEANNETASNLKAAGISGLFEFHEGGFSDLIVGQKVGKWLRQGA